jgi:hypothetical protein
MHGAHHRAPMKRGEAARRLIAEGEDPFRMLLAVVWPGHDWSESALPATLTSCPMCSNGVIPCGECGSTELVTAARCEVLVGEALAAYAYEAA